MGDKPWLAHYDSGVKPTLEYRHIPFFVYLDEAARASPDLVCTVFQDQDISYGEMLRGVNAFAAALHALGVRKGDRVGLLIPNTPQFVLAFYAILKIGCIVVAMNPQYKPRELTYQLRDAGVAVMIALTLYQPVLDEVRQIYPLQEVIYTQLEDAFAIPAVVSGIQPPDASHFLRLLYAYSETSLPAITVSAEDAAIFQYSGGTTGTPKGAIGLHRNLVANTTQFRNWLYGLEENKEVVLCAIPLFHVYGMVIAMGMGIAMGAKLVLAPNPRDVPALLRSIDRYQVTLFPGVPNMYQSINQHPDVIAGRYRLSTIKACISGSAPLLREIKERFEALTSGKLIEGYGLSEAPTATHCNPMFGENRSGSIGLPLPDVDCRIVDLDTGEHDLPPGEAGELVISGPQVMSAYHNMPAETAHTLRGGWLYTGDIARMDEDGYFYLIDRKKALIKVGGLQVWPREIEEVIAAHPKVFEVAAAGVPHPTRVEIVKVWVVLRPGEVMTVADVINWCTENLASYKAPYEVEFRQGLPRTIVGKMLRRELVREHIEKLSS